MLNHFLTLCQCGTKPKPPMKSHNDRAVIDLQQTARDMGLLHQNEAKMKIHKQ